MHQLTNEYERPANGRADSGSQSSPESVVGQSAFSLDSTSLWNSKRILTLDGDGTPGLFTLYVLEALMKEVPGIERTSNPPGF